MSKNNEKKKFSEITVRFRPNEPVFINDSETRLYFNNYKHGRDGVNKNSIRYTCLLKTCSSSITLANDTNKVIDSSKALHNHPPFSDCEVAIEINYVRIRELRLSSTTEQCQKQYDQLLLKLQAEYSVFLFTSIPKL
jgi:hypothetical protein